MKAICIKRSLSSDELSAVRDMIKKGGYTVFSSVSLPDDLAEMIEEAYEISEEEKRQINYEIMDFVVSFGDKEFEGLPVVDWLKFDDSSIWYYHKFRAYFRLRNLSYEIAEVRKLATTYEESLFYASEALLSGVQIPDNITIILPEDTRATKWNYRSLFNYFIILKSRWLINIFSFNKLKKPEHIIMDVTKRQAILDINSLSLIKGNYVIGYLLEKADDNFLIIDEAVQPKMSDGAKISLSRDHLLGKGKLKHRFFGEPVLLGYFLSAKLKKKKRELSGNISKALSELQRLCKEEDEKLLIEIYLSLKGATGFYLIKYLAYRKFFSKHSFKSISTVNENSPAIKCILDAAKKQGIKTIGIQHGNISNLSPAYIYTRADRERSPFPEHSLIWGNSWKEFLVNKGNYKDDSLIVNGQIRTDIIPKLKQADFKKDNVITGLVKNDKLIVFASQPQGDSNLRERAALDVMKAVKDIPESFLVIKLHPNEKNDFGYYSMLAEMAGLDRLQITLSVDLYMLISVCDILITCFSTVGTETVYFGKPLIILDHLKLDIQNYFKEGVAFQASNAKELHKIIEDLLTGAAGIDKNAYENFISKYAFAIDGKAADRALKFITL